MDTDALAAHLRSELTQTELGRIKTMCVDTGIFHLRLAIQAFDGMANGTETEDLDDFLREAIEIRTVLEKALA